MGNRVIEVRYSRTVNIGNFNSEKLECSLQLENGDAKRMLKEVRQFVYDGLGIENPHEQDFEGDQGIEDEYDDVEL